MTSVINIDDEFESYTKVEELIQIIQEKEHSKLWKRDTRTIAAAMRRMPKRTFNPDVKYSELLYCCVHGGRENKLSKSMRQKCSYQIKFRCTADGQKLRCVSINSDHNHPLPDVLDAEPVNLESSLSSDGKSDGEEAGNLSNSDLSGLDMETDLPPIDLPSSCKQQKLKVILDVDTGIDDSHAILMAVAQMNVEVLAICCANGNVNVDLACENTLRVLNACGRDDIPVYRGAECSLMGNKSLFENFSGEAWNTPVDVSSISREHASNAMIRIISEYPGEVSVVALAPLTNLALALRLDSSVSRKIKDLYIMGGNIEARGRISTCAEFNFYNDPEAAEVVLSEFINITILPYEVCCRSLLSWEFFDCWINASTPVSEFLRRSVLESAKPVRAAGRSGYRSCDGFAMAIVIDRSVVLNAEPVFVSVELNGTMTRGQMVVDWDGRLQQPCNALVVKELDVAKLEKLFMRMVQTKECPLKSESEESLTNDLYRTLTTLNDDR